MTKLLFLSLTLALLFTVGCEQQPGTTINNSGDDNAFSVGSNGGITSPTPVIVPPVVVTPPGAETEG